MRTNAIVAIVNFTAFDWGSFSGARTSISQEDALRTVVEVLTIKRSKFEYVISMYVNHKMRRYIPGTVRGRSGPSTSFSISFATVGIVCAPANDRPAWWVGFSCNVGFFRQQIYYFWLKQIQNTTMHILERHQDCTAIVPISKMWHQSISKPHNR